MKIYSYASDKAVSAGRARARFARRPRGAGRLTRVRPIAVAKSAGEQLKRVRGGVRQGRPRGGRTTTRPASSRSTTLASGSGIMKMVA